MTVRTMEKILRALGLHKPTNVIHLNNTHNDQGVEEMEAVQTNKLVSDENQKIISGLREALASKDGEIAGLNEDLNATLDKLKKSRAATKKAKDDLKDAGDVIDSLRDELNDAAVKSVSDASGSERIKMGLFQLKTIIQLNGNSGTIPVDNLKLVVETLTDGEDVQLLLS